MNTPVRPQQRTAADVAQLESDNEYLNSEVERLTRDIAVVTADRNRLQVENAMLQGRSSEMLVKATRMETIIRGVSAGLVDALGTMDRERNVQRQVRRQEQEEQLTGGEPPPQFLRRDLGQETARAAENLAPRRPLVTGQVRTDISDSRLPPADMGLPTDDENELARLGGHIQSTREGS